jgi:hypothetical protein
LIVYEATTQKELQKILDFVEFQADNSLSKFCWTRVRTIKQDFEGLDLINFLKDKIQFIVCEDEQGKVRVVWGARKDDKHPFGGGAFLLMDEQDYQEGNVEFLAKVFDDQIRKRFNNGLMSLTYWTSKKHLEFSQKICGDALQIIRDIESGIYGKLWHVKVDFKKYLANQDFVTWGH